MSVTGATTRNDYVSSSGQTVFPYTFQTLLASDIKVLKNGVALTLNNDYSVSNAGVAGGGSITLVTGASAGDSLSVFLAMPIDRTTQYQNAGDFLASDVNGDFDKGYIAMNQLQTDIKRSIGLDDADPTVNMTLPLKSVRANKYLKFNALGAVTVSDTAAGSDTSVDLGLANVMDYGAVGDGVADDTLAARNCIAYAVANSLIAYFPPGDYKITGNILNYLKLVDGGQSPKIVGAGRGLTKFTVVGAQTNYLFIAYGDTTSYGNTSHPSGLLLQGFSVIGDYANTQNIFDLAMLSYFSFVDVNTFQCKGTSLRMRECWEGDVSGLRVVRSGDNNVYAVICDYYFSDRKADSACNNINFGKDFQCEASAWSAMYWGRNTRKCLFQGKIHPLLSTTYTVPAFVMDGSTNCTVIGANISWKNVKSLRLTNVSGYIPSENIITNSTISGGIEVVGSCRRNTIVYNTGGISKQQDAYIATSGQTVFAYTFLAAAEKNILVTKNGEELVLTTDPGDPKDYTLSGIGNANGGNVTLTVGATTSDDVVVSPVEDEFITIAGGTDNVVFGNNPSGAGIEVSAAAGFNFLPAKFYGRSTVGTFESVDTNARVEFKDPNGSSRVGTRSSKLILEAAHTGDPSNAKISFEIAGSEVAKIDNNGNITANNLPVNVKTFGAVGDGSTSDTVAITAAINSGESLYVPDGTFYIPNWSTITRSTPLKMQGTGTIKGLNKADTFVNCLSDVTITGVRFEKFAFLFFNAFGESGTVDRFSLDNVTVKDCGGGISLERPVNSFSIQNCVFDTITANKPVRVGKNDLSAQDTWKNFTITGNTFRNISTVSGTDCNVLLIYGRNAAISNNTFETIGAEGTFEFFNGDGSDKTFTVTESGLNEGQCTLYLIIGGVDVEQINTDDATLWTLDGTTLTFTTAPASGTNNIKFYYAGESAAIYTKARFATITGNTISGMGKLPNGSTTLNINQIYGINVKGRGRGDVERVNGFNVTVTGNILEGVNGAGSGIRIQNDCVNVTGNNIERFRFGINGNTAIHDDSNITSNNIYHCQQYGINVIQSGVNCIIQSNSIAGVDVGSGVYEPLAAIRVRAHYDTKNYNISNNAISGCKKGIQLSSTAESRTDWTASTAFAVGAKVVNNSINYKCTTAGTSASSGGPTGTGSAITDGSVVWQYIISAAELSNVLISNNVLDTVTNNGIEFASCNTITLDNNQYVGEVANTFIRPVNPNQNVTIRDSRTKSFNTGTLQTIQTWNTSIVDQVARITASVTGKQGDAEFAAYKITGLFKVVSGTLTQVGSTVTEYAITSSGAASWDVPSFTLSADDVYLRVRGTQVTDTPTQWSAKTEYVSTTDALL